MYNTYIAYTSRGPGAGSALKDFVEFVLISVFNRTHTLTSLLHSLHMGEGCRESGGGDYNSFRVYYELQTSRAQLGGATYVHMG